MKNYFAKCLIVLVSHVLLLSCSTPPAEPPNIVFFLVDDLGWRDVGSFGSTFYETPNIDRLTAEGVKFTQAYAASHVCSPTRASIMTGKYPARLHLTDWLQGRQSYAFEQLRKPEYLPHLPLEEITLAEAFKQHGYQTGHIGKWHLGEDPYGPLEQGFDMQVPDWNKGWPKAGYYAPFELDGLDDEPGQYLTDRLTDVAVAYIESNKDQPFFLHMSHFAVHDPIHGRPDLVEKYRQKMAQQDMPEGPDFILEGNPDDANPLSRAELAELIEQPSHEGHKVLPQRTFKIKQHQDNIHFAAMVESMDESLGRIMDTLEAQGLSDNTIIVFFSDNGGMSGANVGWATRVVESDKLDLAYATSNLPLRGAKGWLYEGGVRVPMVVKWPAGAKAGSESETLVMSTDFYPSLLELAGLPQMPVQAVDGVSFVPSLKGETVDRDPIYWHFPQYSNHGMQSPGGGVRSGDYKLLEYYENNTVQLFNLREDIGEQNNLALAEPEKAAELLSLLHDWRADVQAQMPVPNPDYDSGSYPHLNN
ncbi:MAG: sulfatase [Bacteroidota bacterium]